MQCSWGQCSKEEMQCSQDAMGDETVVEAVV